MKLRLAPVILVLAAILCLSCCAKPPAEPTPEATVEPTLTPEPSPIPTATPVPTPAVPFLSPEVTQQPFAEGERTEAVLASLDCSSHPVYLRISAQFPMLPEDGESELEVYTSGKDVLCVLTQEETQYGLLLTDGRSWMLLYDSKTYYECEPDAIQSLQELLLDFYDGEPRSYDCGQTAVDGELYDYETFIDGGQTVSFLFTPGTDALQYMIADDVTARVLDLISATPEDAFKIPSDFKEIHPE